MSADKSCYVGYLVQVSHLQDFVKSYRSDVCELLNEGDKSIYEKHNCYVSWVLTLLYFSTSHRPVGDPFCYSRQISLDDGWCLIDDKAVEESRRFRLAPLSATSIEQLQHYYLHLQMLGSRLSRNKEYASLGKQILSVQSCPDNPGLPLFFYLHNEGRLVTAKGISASDVHETWRKYIELPRNEGRRSLASSLKSNNVDSELIRILLGHEDGLSSHFDYLSRWSPRDAMRDLSVEINKLQELWGFQGVPSFLKNKINARQLKNSDIVQAFEFGPEKRKADRERLASDENDLVCELIDNLESRSYERLLTESDVNDLLEKTVSMAQTKKLNPSRCLRLTYKYLRKERDRLDKEAGKAVRKRVPVAKPSGKIHENLVAEYRSFERARKTFFQIIAASNFSNLSENEKVAFISISAVLMDYLVIKQVVHQIMTELPESVYRVGNIIVGDYFLKESKRSCFNPPFYRWVPGGFSRALLLQICSDQIPSNSQCTQEVFQKYKVILKQLFPHKKSAKEREEHLFCIAKSALFINKHPLIRAGYELESGYTALSGVALERVVNGKVAENCHMVDPGGESFTFLRNSNASQEKSPFKESNERLYKKLDLIFWEARNTPVSGNNRHKKQLKKVIRKKIFNLLKSSGWTVAGEVLLRWAVDLCTSGTHHKENLAFSTINKYVFIMARPLLDQAQDTNILAKDEVYFEWLYVRMASYSKSDSSYVINRMREFHRFCESRYSVPRLDWSAIYSEARPSQEGEDIRKADANILSDMEYRAALSFLVDNANRAPLYECQLGFCLIMGYRFGLRIDEVFSLLERQVRFNEDLTAIWVTPGTNIYGDGKSESFNRNIPLLFELDEIEKSIFRRIVDASEAQIREVGGLVFLMAQEGKSRELLDKQKVSQQLSKCLKRVTGDETVKFHHLRHTWATSIGASVVEAIDGKVSYFVDLFQQGKTVRKGQVRKLLGLGKPNIMGVSKILGHANIDTFIASYFHCLEYGESVFKRPQERKLADCALAKVLNISDASLRKRYSRFKDEKNDTTFPLTSREIKCFPELKIEKASFQVETEAREQEASEKQISLTILNRILLDFQEGGDKLGDRSARYGLKRGAMEKMLKQALDLEMRSRYEGYQLNCISKKNKEVMGVFTNRSENERFKNYLSDIENSNDGKGLQADLLLRNFANTWEWGYCPRKNYFILRNADGFESVRDGIARLGIGGTIELITGSSDQKKELDALKLTSLANIEIKVLASFSPDQKVSKSVKNDVFGIRLQGLPAKIKTMGTFHRFMFLLSLYLSLESL